jgi:Dolichyl-phosphate-mannose-protein mannosyltransferase
VPTLQLFGFKGWIQLRELVVLICILSVGALLRIWSLGTVPVALWFDEITGHYVPFLVIHGYFGTQIWAEIHSPVPSTTTQLYYLAYSAIQGPLWVAAFKTSSAFWIRLPAVVYGTLTLLLLYCLGKELYDSRVGLVAAAAGVLCPWLFYFSRFMDPPTSLEFWPLVAVYVGLAGVHRRSPLLLGLSVFFGGLVPYTHLAGIAVLGTLLIPLWGYWAISLTPRRPAQSLLSYLNKLFWNSTPYLAVLVLTTWPLILYQWQPVSNLTVTPWFVWQHCSSAGCTLSLFTRNVLSSWSPDFFAISGGLAGAQIAGSQSHISIGGVWQLGGGFTGMLSTLGWLVYPAIVLPIILALYFRRVDHRAVLSILLTLSYTVVGGLIYFDNPNAGRLAFAAGFFVILIAALLVWVFEKLSSILARAPATLNVSPSRALLTSARTRRGWNVKHVILAVGVSAILVPTSVVYANEYFNEFPIEGAQYFDPIISQAASMLSDHDLWGYPIVVSSTANMSYIVPGELEFYDPSQPPPHGIVAFNGSLANAEYLFSSELTTVFVSLTGTSATMLKQAGIAAVTVAEDSPISIYKVFTNASPHIQISAIDGWAYSPTTSILPATLNWSVTHLSTNVTIQVVRQAGNLSVHSNLTTSSSTGGYWELTAYLPKPVPLPPYSFLSVSWAYGSTGTSQSLAMLPVYSNSTLPWESSVRLAYPGSLINILPGAPPSSGVSLEGLSILAGLGGTQGFFQNTSLGNITIYGVLPNLTQPCVAPPLVIEGSSFDVATPLGSSLEYNSFKSTLNLTLCIDSSIPANITTSYLEISFTIISPFSMNMQLQGQLGGLSANVSNIGGPPNAAFRFFLGFPSSQSEIGDEVQAQMTFSGQIRLDAVQFVAFYGG